MSVASLKKQLQKELTTNPKKAAILGLLMLVAVYFWAPLALKMVSGKSKGTSKASTAVASESDTNKTDAAQGVKSAKQAAEALQNQSAPAFSWDQILGWMMKDPLMASRPELQNKHNPFQSEEKIIEVPTAVNPLANQGAEQTPEAVRDLSPEALGMTLTSTIVGQQRSVAMIDERAYALGQRVEVFDGATPLRFQLVEIRPEMVILERDDQHYALKLKQKDELTVSLEDPTGL